MEGFNIFTVHPNHESLFAMTALHSLRYLEDTLVAAPLWEVACNRRIWDQSVISYIQNKVMNQM